MTKVVSLFASVAVLSATLLSPLTSQASSYSLYRAAYVSAPDTLTLSQGTFGDLASYDCSLTTYTCGPAATKPEVADDLPTLENQTRSFTDPSGKRVLLETVSNTKSGRLTTYTLFTKTESVWDTGTVLSTPPFIIGRVIWDGLGRYFIYRAEDPQNGSFAAQHYDQLTGSASDFAIDGDALYLDLNYDGTKFTYYRPAVTNTSTEKEMVLWQKTTTGFTDSRFRYSVTQPWELNLDVNRLLTFSPSGDSFVFISDESGYQQPRLYTKSMTSIASSTPITWPDLNTVADVLLISDETLYIVANTKSAPYEWSIYRYTITNETIEKVASDVSIMYALERVGDNILFAQISGSNMVPVVLDTAAGSLHRFSRLSTITTSYQLTNKTLSFDSGAHGVLMRKTKALGQDKQPLIVWLHGGPYRQTSVGYHSYPGYATYDWLLGELAQAGATILKIDYPGSYGYGNEYTYSLLNHNGLADTEAIMDAITETKRAENIRGPVYVMGNSYGGYLAPKLITEYPDKITGAIAINGVYEWRTLLKYLRTSIFNVHFSGVYNPFENAELYNQASIALNVDALTPSNKLMLVTGTSDGTINTDQAYSFAELLTLMNKDVTHVLIPGEDHVLKQKASNELLCQSAFDFINLPTFREYCTL